MRKFIFLLLVLPLASCVDKDWDLGKVNTDNIAIGDEQSEFTVPMANITVNMAELRNGNDGIDDIFREVDVWLPAALPGGATYVEIDRMGQPAYLGALIDALFAEMTASATKMDAVLELIWGNGTYRNSIVAALPGVDTNVAKNDFKDAFKLAWADSTYGADLRASVKTLAEGFLPSIEIQAIQFPGTPIDLGDDVIDMLADNLKDGATISLTGTAMSTLPLSFDVVPTFGTTGITFPDPININKDVETPFHSNNITTEGLRSLLGSMDLSVDFVPRRYYPGDGFVSQDEIVIRLRLKKTGGLSL